MKNKREPLKKKKRKVKFRIFFWSLVKPKNETDAFVVARSIQRKIFDKKITLHVIFQEVCVYYYFFYVLFSLDKENIYIKESVCVYVSKRKG